METQVNTNATNYTLNLYDVSRWFKGAKCIFQALNYVQKILKYNEIERNEIPWYFF
jgi:hypothetical protein